MSICRICNAAKTKAYVQANKEKVRASEAIHRAKNKEVICKRGRDRRLNNLDEIRAKDRERYQENRDVIRSRQKDYYYKRQDLRIAYSKAYRANNPEYCKKIMAAYYLENRSKIRATQRQYYIDNKDKFLGYSRARAAAKSPGFMRERAMSTARRRAAIRKAIPLWFDPDACSRIYDLANKMTEEAGIKHEVDHIIPVKSSLVCGLHWHGNMRVITKTENAAKGNRHWPDMPD